MAERLCPLSVGEKKALALAPSLTYAALDNLTGRAVHQLRSWGLEKGDCIALPSHANEKTIALLFAAWRLSLIVALISPGMPPAGIQKHLQEIHPRLLIDDASRFFAESFDERRELDLDSIALLLLSSGSSGDAKWAAFTLSQLFESAETVARTLGAQPEDRWLLSLPLHHVGGLGVLLRAFCSGGTVVPENKQLPYPERIESAHARYASLVPTQLYRLMQCDFQTISTQLLIGGAPMAQNLYDRAIEKNLRLLLTYGLTEMSSTLFLTSRPVWNNQIPYLGLPLPGRQVKIFQDELLVSGASLFAGYGNPPRRPFTDWFSSGDCAIYHERYGFGICGRKDFQFISGGENIQPEEIEMAILSCPNVEQAIVVPLFDEELGTRPMGFVKTSLSHHQILHYLSTFLPKFKIPIALAELPNSDNFKPNRAQLIQFANKNYHIINTLKP